MAKTEKRGPGRPPSRVKRFRYQVCLSEEENQRIRQYAEDKHLKVGTLIRMLAFEDVFAKLAVIEPRKKSN